MSRIHTGDRGRLSLHIKNVLCPNKQFNMDIFIVWILLFSWRPVQLFQLSDSSQLCSFLTEGFLSLWAVATTTLSLSQTPALSRVTHQQCGEDQSGHFFVKRRGMVFMACLHRVKYLCMRPPSCTCVSLCAHVVNMCVPAGEWVLPLQRKMCNV